MANTILGIDLGSYSVKVARLETSLRNMQLVGIFELRVPEPAPLNPPPVEKDADSGPGIDSQAGDSSDDSSGEVRRVTPSSSSHNIETLFDRQMRALDVLLTQVRGKAETSGIGLADEVTLRLLDLPLNDPKKAALAIPFELAGQLMTDINDQVVDQTLAQPGGRAPGEKITTGSAWLTACAPRQVVMDRLQAFQVRKLDPRIVGALAMAPAALYVSPSRGWRPGGAPSAQSVNTSPADELPLWVIDIGHRHTHVCALIGTPGKPGQVTCTFVRTIARGGEQFTEAVARVMNVDRTRAERMKHEYGLGEEEPKVSSAIREAMRPLLRELRQTMAAYRSRYNEGPRAIKLCGGSSHMRGLHELLQNELDVDVLPLGPPIGAPWLDLAQREGSRAALSLSLDDLTARVKISSVALVQRFTTGAGAVGLALAATGVQPQFNFRKGDLAYRTDYAFLRERAPYLAVFFATLFLCIGGWAYASMRLLEKESERLRQQLVAETTALFGEPRTDGNAVSQELRSAMGLEKGPSQRVPAVSALDLIEDISKAAPEGTTENPARLDVYELHIRPKQVDLKATAGSAQYVDDFAAAVGKISCFKSVKKGKVLTVKNNGPDGKPIDVKQFSLEITTTCQ